MITDTDKILLEYYRNGWQGKKPIPVGYDHKIAYEIGEADFIAGDDVSSVDMQTDEQILEHIKSLL